MNITEADNGRYVCRAAVQSDARFDYKNIYVVVHSMCTDFAYKLTKVVSFINVDLTFTCSLVASRWPLVYHGSTGCHLCVLTHTSYQPSLFEFPLCNQQIISSNLLTMPTLPSLVKKIFKIIFSKTEVLKICSILFPKYIVVHFIHTVL